MNRPHVKNLIIAGAAGNLGRETVKKFLTDGRRVASVVQTQTQRDELVEFLAALHGPERHIALIGDLHVQKSCSDIVEKAFAFLGSIDAALSTMGAFQFANIEDTNDANYDLLFNSNFKSCWMLARHVIPHMKRARNGRLVFLSSLSTQGRGTEGMSLYLASKAALNMLTLCLSREVHAHGITVNTLMPSVIDTLSNRKSMPKEDFSKWVQPDDLVAIMDNLLSEPWCTVNGSLIAVPGKL